MSSQAFSYLFKFVIVGESGVGKSCLVLNFTEKKPRKQHQITIACEFASRVIDLKGMKVKVQIWDTAGQENFRSITRSYYRASVAAVIVYDLTSLILRYQSLSLSTIKDKYVNLNSRTSFDKVTGWLAELHENAQDDISIVLVGNKLDLESQREVPYDEALNYAKQNGMKFTETCAFDLSTIEPMFIGLANDILKDIEEGNIDPTNELTGVKMGAHLQNSKNNKNKRLKKNQGGGGTRTGRKKCCSSS